MITRRSMLLGLGAALAAPAVVRAESLMRIAAPKLITDIDWLYTAKNPMLPMPHADDLIDIRPGAVTYVDVGDLWWPKWDALAKEFIPMKYKFAMVTR